MIFWIVSRTGTIPKYRDKKTPINLLKLREITRAESIDVNKKKSWEKVTKLHYNFAYKTPKQKILHLYYRFHKEYAEIKNKTHILLTEGRSCKKPCNKNLELPLKCENCQHENKEMKKTKNIDNLTIQIRKWQKHLSTTPINRIPKKNWKYLKYRHQKDIHRKQQNQASAIVKMEIQWLN